MIETGDHPQAMPAWDRQSGLNEIQQADIESAEDMMGEILAGFGKSLSAGSTNGPSLVNQMGEEGIQFVLNAGLEAGEHGHNENGESQDPLTEECVGFESRLVEQFVRMEVVDKVDNNTLVLRSPW